MSTSFKTIFLSLLFVFTSLNAKTDDFKLSIFHVNDIHSHITSEEISLKIKGVKTYVQIGGYARLLSKYKELKKSKANSLILNAGDTFQGTLFYSLFKGKADAAALNLIPWDAYALGNHEFDDGDEALSEFLGLLNKNIPILAANIKADKNNILYNKWKPYIIKTIDGNKIGIIGIDIVEKTVNSSNPSDEIRFSDELKTAQEYINILQKKGVNKIILLTHIGLENDIRLAQELKGLDIIVGGDSHSLLGDYSNIGLKSSTNEYPLKIKSKNNTRVCIVQAWESAHLLGSFDVVFNELGEVIQCSGNAKILIGDTFKIKDKNGKKVLVSKKKEAEIKKFIKNASNIQIIEEDKSALNMISTYENKVAKEKAKIIGKAQETLGHNRIPNDAYDKQNRLPLGSDIAPIIAKSFYDLSKLADASIQNAGGVRIALNKGEISMADAYAILPFSNTLFEIQMTGSEIKQVLEDAINNVITGGSTGSFPYAYALRYDVNMKNNNRISNLEIMNRKTKKWSLINKDKMYVIVTNSYTARGKDGYKTFKTVQDKRGQGVNTYLDYALSFVKYVQDKNRNAEGLLKLPKEEHPIKSFVQ